MAELSERKLGLRTGEMIDLPEGRGHGVCGRVGSVGWPRPFVLPFSTAGVWR